MSIGIPNLPETDAPTQMRSAGEPGVKDVSVAADVPDISMPRGVRPTDLAAIAWRDIPKPSYAVVRRLRKKV
jgi:hypothetical protein